MNRVRTGLATGSMLIALASCASGTGTAAGSASTATSNLRSASELEITDTRVGAGARATVRQCMYVHYVGVLADGRQFDSSRDTLPNGRMQPPLVFELGTGAVMQGWEKGLVGMQVGGLRRLWVPYRMAYGGQSLTLVRMETRIGVGVLVLRDGCVLLGERLGSHGAHTWAPPGGHLEADETVAACAQRELLEETGLVLRECTDGPWSVNDFPEIARRYATLFVVVRAFDGEPVVREPSKCASWRWFSWAALRDGNAPPLFTPLASLVASGWAPSA